MPYNYKLTLNKKILPPRGRPSSLILNSISTVSDEYRRCSRIAHTNTDARSTPQEWKSVFIFWMDRVVHTTLKTSFFNALISFLVKRTAVSLARCKQAKCLALIFLEMNISDDLTF